MVNSTHPTALDADQPAVKKFYTPSEAAARWRFHTESVRRILRERRMASVIIGRRRLIPAEEMEKVEREGFLSRIERICQ
jgi:excisionase family DNA binding protein